MCTKLIYVVALLNYFLNVLRPGINNSLFDIDSTDFGEAD